MTLKYWNVPLPANRPSPASQSRNYSWNQKKWSRQNFLDSYQTTGYMYLNPSSKSENQNPNPNTVPAPVPPHRTRSFSGGKDWIGRISRKPPSPGKTSCNPSSSNSWKTTFYTDIATARYHLSHPGRNLSSHLASYYNWIPNRNASGRLHLRQKDYDCGKQQNAKARSSSKCLPLW